MRYPARSTGKPLLAAARWAGGIGLVAILLLQVDPTRVADLLARANPVAALIGTVGLVAAHLIGAATWSILMHRLTGSRLGRGEVIRAYYLAQGVGSLTPANLGADLYRLHATRAEVGWRRALEPIVVQRFTSAVALAGIAMAALAVVPRPWEISAIVISAAIGLATISSVMLVGGSAVARRLGGSPPQAPASEVNSADVRWRVGTYLLGLGLAALFHAVSLGCSLLLVLAVAPSAEPAPVLGSLAIARLAILVPVTPSGLGFQEGALSLLFLRLGLGFEVALATALLARVAMLGTAGIGIVLAATPRGPSIDAAPAASHGA